ncbi:DUF2169 family type VI secretion system accessory protein [Myxococcus stipitatus]|uniref:DUF2169 family type VI secretion system accessory protein n=1 Tax=Myxococcus stipitatus TaxID=83455 RepID=UPI0005C716F8|nr:DUF2169 domain-containing protein [Myxococcus stipitatus]
MLTLDNRTPYAAERAFVRDKTGIDHWVVIVKATYDIATGGVVRLADRQEPPLLESIHWGDPGKSSIRFETDFVLMKPGTDVLVNGTAHAPKGKAVAAVPIRVRVSTIDKTLIVSGVSVFYQGAFDLKVTKPFPFVSMPIRYEQAYGGSDTTSPDPKEHRADMRNPIGVGFATRSAHLADKPAPSVLYPAGDARKNGPAGYGAIPTHWSPRRELGGTYDEHWLTKQKPLLPTDWTEECLLCAPVDQRVAGHLHGGESVELVHMTPSGVLRFALPKVFLSFATHFGRKVEEHRSKLVTVIVEPDEARVLLVWQTTLKVPLRMMDYLDKTVITEKRHVR